MISDGKLWLVAVAMGALMGVFIIMPESSRFYASVDIGRFVTTAINFLCLGRLLERECRRNAEDERRNV